MLGDFFNNDKSDQHFGVVVGEARWIEVYFDFLCKCEFQFLQVCLIFATVKSFIFIFRNNVVIYVTILFSFN
jgi:hypothetical protein